MKMSGSILRKLEAVFPARTVYAHCDVPCGVYETDSITHAADTVEKMVEKIQAIEDPSSLEGRNTLIRMVSTKEEFAQKCKQELLILWTDYFKAEHLMEFPDLHDKFWKATKLCSSAKRTVDLKIVKQLKEAVAEIAEIFKKTK